MVRDIPKTTSGSSAKRIEMEVPSFGSSSDRITEASKTGVLGDKPVKVTQEVKYKEYENDKRMTEDFATASNNASQTQGFDGATPMMPQGEPAASYIDTSHSIK